MDHVSGLDETVSIRKRGGRENNFSPHRDLTLVLNSILIRRKFKNRSHLILGMSFYKGRFLITCLSSHKETGEKNF
jgi:hypothetical protein